MENAEQTANAAETIIDETEEKMRSALSEALFINTYTPSKADFKTWPYIKTGVWIAFYTLGCVDLFFSICGLSSMLHRGESISSLLVTLLICTVFLFSFLPIRRLFLMKRFLQTELFMGNGEFQKRCFIFGKELITWHTGQQSYHAISRVFAVKHGVLLRISNLFAIYVRADSFTKGDMTSFLQFLITKGVKLPGKCLKKYGRSLKS